MVCETKIVATEDHEALPGAKKDALLAAAGAMWPPLPAAPGPAAAPPPAAGPQPHGGTGGAGPPEGRGVCIREFRAAEQEAARRIFYDGILERIPNTAFRGLRQHPRTQLLYALLAGQCAAGGGGPAGLRQSCSGPGSSGSSGPLRGPSRLSLFAFLLGSHLEDPVPRRCAGPVGRRLACTSSAAIRAFGQGSWAGRGNQRGLSTGRCGLESTGLATQSAAPVLSFAGHPGWGRRDRAGSAAAAARRDNYIYNLQAGEAA